VLALNVLTVWKRIAQVLATCVCLGVWATTVWCQGMCDGTLMGVHNHPFGYRLRGDRCEGIYWEPHTAGGTFAIISIRGGQAPLLTETPDVVRFTWPIDPMIPPKTEVLIRGVNLRSGLYYRLDARKSYLDGVYNWPTDIIRGLGLTAPEIAVSATTRVKIGSITWNVILPLAEDSSPRGSSSYDVVLIASTAILRLSWELREIDTDGTPGRRVGHGVLAKQFRAGEAIRVPVDLPGFRGLCYLEFHAEPAAARASYPLTASTVFLIPRQAKK
jgi:hypothetical protein